MSWAPGAVIGWLILLVFGGGLLVASVWAIIIGALFLGVLGLVVFFPMAWIMLSELKTYYD
jgi:hypothetical protein